MMMSVFLFGMVFWQKFDIISAALDDADYAEPSAEPSEFPSLEPSSGGVNIGLIVGLIILGFLIVSVAVRCFAIAQAKRKEEEKVTEELVDIVDRDRDSNVAPQN